MGKMLLVFAHPDDESFAVGGAVPKYVAGGWQVDLVCATRGEAGSRGPYDAASPEKLAKIRESELQQAATILGIASVVFLDYPDGTLNQLHAGELEDKLNRIMTVYQPDIVITFEPGGISNHPDHIRLSIAATFAFQKYAATNEKAKLYFVCVPQSQVAYFIKQKIIPGESFSLPWKGTEDKLISHVIDIRRFRRKKIRALNCHISQREDIARFLSLSSNILLRQEYFVMRFHGRHESFMGKYDRVAGRL